MKVFNKIIQHKRVSDAGQLFLFSYVWNDRPSVQWLVLQCHTIKNKYRNHSID